MLDVNNKNSLFQYYNVLNKDEDHKVSNDDICTPMKCVELMINYLPQELWERTNLKILDPCCGNGNFGAYCKFKTSINNIWFNELNKKRLNICKKILNPPNTLNKDFFTIQSFDSWDLIMANPPYSGGGNKNQSLSNLFIEHSVKLLKNGGYLCFVTPNNWMTYNNNNSTLKTLLENGSFLVIDNDIHKYFPSVGSSFAVFIWQKGVHDNKTYVKNNYVIKDVKRNIVIPSDIKFIPLYISKETISISKKIIQNDINGIFKYRCDLHNHTQKEKLRDFLDEVYMYETIHTARQTRYSNIKQDIFDKWIIIVPLSTYFVPYVKHNVNVTQSVGYMAFNNLEDAERYLELISRPEYKTIIHLTRYGNFNNIMVLKHLKLRKIRFNKKEKEIITKITSSIKY